MLALSTVVGVLLAAVFGQCIYNRYHHPLSRYPGPLLASFTDLWGFFTFFCGDHHLIEQRLHERYGHVVRTGPNRLSFSALSDFDAIYGFNKFIEKGDFFAFSRSKGQTETIFSSRTDFTHRERRRQVVGPALLATKVASYEPVVVKNISVLLSRLTALLKARSAIDVSRVVHRYTFDTIIEVIYGSPVCPQPYTDSRASAGILEAIPNVSRYTWGCAHLPWFRWFMSTSPVQYLTRRPPTHDSEGILTGIGALASQAQRLVISQPENARESSQPSIVKNYLSVPQDDPNCMPPGQILRETLNLSFAGSGSTAAALTGLLYRLGVPEGHVWQSHIRSEQKENSTNSGGSGAAPSSPLSIPPVLTAVIKETLRLDTPFPTGFPRVIAPGAETALATLPEPLPVGTTVSANTFVLGHSKALWGADAEAWKPERWLEIQSEAEKRELEEKFVAFSKGARRCIGKELAMMITAKAIVAVLDKWVVNAESAPKAKAWLEMRYEECLISFTPRAGKEEL